MTVQLTDKGKQQAISQVRAARAAILTAVLEPGDPANVKKWLDVAGDLLDEIEVALCLEWRVKLSAENVFFSEVDDLPF
jgi:hypothetical protein